MIKDIESVAYWALQKMDMYSKDALHMIMRTGMAETGFRHLKQMGDGPALGFFQVEPKTIADTMENYVKYRPKIEDNLIELGYIENDVAYRVIGNIALQVAFCRLKYRRDKYALPKWDDMEGQAKYWKRVYNSKLGKGTIEHFMEANKDYKIGD